MSDVSYRDFNHLEKYNVFRHQDVVKGAHILIAVFDGHAVSESHAFDFLRQTTRRLLSPMNNRRSLSVFVIAVNGSMPRESRMTISLLYFCAAVSSISAGMIWLSVPDPKSLRKQPVP
jgi:hypothetical protein